MRLRKKIQLSVDIQTIFQGLLEGFGIQFVQSIVDNQRRLRVYSNVYRVGQRKEDFRITST